MKQFYRHLSLLASAMAFVAGGHAEPISPQIFPAAADGKAKTSIRHSAARTSVREEITDTEIIREAPGESRSYVRNSNGFFYYYGDVHNAILEGKSQTLVIDGSDAYLYNPVSTLPTDSYLKGTVTEEGIEFSFPQCVYTQEYWDSDLEDYVEQYIWLHPVELDVDSEGASWYYVKDTTPSTYTLPLLDDGTYKMEFSWRTDIYDTLYEEYYEMPEMAIGMIDKDWNWMAYGDFYDEFIPFEEEPVALPDGIDAEQWAFMYGGEGRFINVAFDSDNVWLQGISASLPQAWVRGDRVGADVVFTSMQYLGNDDYGMLEYFRAAKEEMVYDEDYAQEVKKIVMKDNVSFTFDVDNKSMTTDGVLLITGYGNDPAINETYKSPAIFLQPSDISPIPANPKPIAYSPYDDMWMMGWIWFDVPVVNIDGYLLGNNNMAWRWFINGEPYTFDTWDYWGLPETTEWISCDYSDIWDFQKFGATEWYVYTYTPDIETLEVQSRYTDPDGKEYFSERIECANTTSVSVAKDAEAVEVVMFDLTGNRIERPAEGIYVERTIFSDGSVRTVKRMGK